MPHKEAAEWAIPANEASSCKHSSVLLHRLPRNCKCRHTRQLSAVCWADVLGVLFLLHSSLRYFTGLVMAGPQLEDNTVKIYRSDLFVFGYFLALRAKLQRYLLQYAKRQNFAEESVISRCHILRGGGLAMSHDAVGGGHCWGFTQVQIILTRNPTLQKKYRWQWNSWLS